MPARWGAWLSMWATFCGSAYFPRCKQAVAPAGAPSAAAMQAANVAFQTEGKYTGASSAEQLWIALALKAAVYAAYEVDFGATTPRDGLTLKQLEALLQEARGLSFCLTCDFVGLWETHYAHNKLHHGMGCTWALEHDTKRAVEVLAAWLLPRLGRPTP